MTTDPRKSILTRYAAGVITAEQAADELGPGVSVAEVIVETSRCLGRLPNQDDAFTRSEYRRGLALLGLTPTSPRPDGAA